MQERQCALDASQIGARSNWIAVALSLFNYASALSENRDGLFGPMDQTALAVLEICDSLHGCEEEQIMAKGQMKSMKEARKPKKDAAKKSAAAAKAAPGAKSNAKAK